MKGTQEKKQAFRTKFQSMRESRRRFRLRSLTGQLALKRGFGLNEVIGIAAGIIIAVVVVIPGLQGFAGDILENLTDWWNNMAASIFATP